jgi:hypothetical protein
MTKRQSRQYEMLVRVGHYGVAYKALFPEASEGGKAFAAVTDAAAQIEALTNARLTARRLSKGEKLAAKRALAARIGAIARSAQVMAKAAPGADAKFPLPTRQSDMAILQTGRLFLQEVGSVKDAFIRCGLAATFVEELQHAVSRLEETIKGRSDGKTSAVVARKGIRSILKKAVDAVRSLDVLVANALGGDEAAMNAWKRDRHVEFSGRTAAVGAPPPENSVPPPATPTEHPNVPAHSDSASDASPPEASVGESMGLRRAS